jgi:hypothetical protein
VPQTRGPETSGAGHREEQGWRPTRVGRAALLFLQAAKKRGRATHAMRRAGWPSDRDAGLMRSALRCANNMKINWHLPTVTCASGVPGLEVHHTRAPPQERPPAPRVSTL